MAALERILAPALLLLVAVGASAQGAPPTCTDAAFHQFDFWVGDWEVTQADGSRAGHNRVESILDGCVVMENWEGAGGSTGKSFNMFDVRGDGKWHQTWVDGSGGRLDLVGGLDEEGRMVLSGERPGREGGTVLHRITWTPRPDGTVQQHWQASKNGGETWDDLFLGIYSRGDAAD